MEDKLAKFGALVRRFSLSRDEKAVLRRQLEEMTDRPVSRPGWFARLASAWPRSAAGSFGMRPAFSPVLAVTMAALLVGAVGVSYAAEGALPGDALYAVKVRFNEEMVGKLTSDPLEKVSWEETRAVRRLDEAATLQTQNRLDDAARQDIVGGYIEHMERAVEKAKAAGSQGKATVERVKQRLRSEWQKPANPLHGMKAGKDSQGDGEPVEGEGNGSELKKAGDDAGTLDEQRRVPAADKFRESGRE